jgi:hypothetical protein
VSSALLIICKYEIPDKRDKGGSDEQDSVQLGEVLMYSYTVSIKMNPHSGGSSYRVQLFRDANTERTSLVIDLHSIQEVMSALDRCGIRGLDASQAIAELVKERSVLFHNLAIEDKNLSSFGCNTPLVQGDLVDTSWTNP